ncbi:hypothetical protein [Polaromonas sp. CG9_12]|nr:hypothetical protein [Polaromonas sp. CG9_12]
MGRSDHSELWLLKRILAARSWLFTLLDRRLNRSITCLIPTINCEIKLPKSSRRHARCAGCCLISSRR